MRYYFLYINISDEAETMKKLLLFLLVVLLGGTTWLWFSGRWQSIPVIEHLIGPYLSKSSTPASIAPLSRYAPPSNATAPVAMHAVAPCKCPVCPQAPVAALPPHSASSVPVPTSQHPMSPPYPGTAGRQPVMSPAAGHPMMPPQAVPVPPQRRPVHAQPSAPAVPTVQH